MQRPSSIQFFPPRRLVHIARNACCITAFSVLPVHAQTSNSVLPASTTAGSRSTVCAKRTGVMSPGEKAIESNDLPKAESLLREESHAAGPEGDRAHNALIRILLREEKFDEARKNVDEWSKGAPRNVWTVSSAGEVAWREGDLNEALQRFNAAAALDTCNPWVHADRALFLRFSGMNASAKLQIENAHRLDPIDPAIAETWDGLQPRAVRLQNLENYLSHADALTPEQRKPLEHWRDRLRAPRPEDACHLTGATTSTALPFRRIQDGPNAPVYWGLDVAFNGKQRRLEIDTGAHGLLLSRSAANALHLDVSEKGQSYGVGDEGAVSSHTSRVKSIKIGNLEFENCDVDILESNSKALEAQDGLIGGDVFSSFLLTLDFPGHLLKLDPLPPRPEEQAKVATPTLEIDTSASDQPPQDIYVDPSMKTWTKVMRAGHDLILPIRLNDGPIRLFIVDTGAQFDSISPEMARQVAKVSKGSYVDIVGISGKVNKTYTSGPLTLTFANLKYPSPGMLGMENTTMSRDVGVEIAGFLGAETLHELTVQIDYRDDLMHFTFDPKRVVRCSGTRADAGDCY